MKKLTVIRETELFISEKYNEGFFRCPVHLAIGHEAIPASLFSLYTDDRFIFSYHRSHHHFLGCGGTPEELLFELAGLESGCCHGHGGSHHLRSESVGFLGSTPIITGTIPVAVGYAHSLKLRNKKGRVFVFSGDSIAEEGLFYESLNMACLYKLPITFVVEDNGLSCFTPSKDRQGHKGYSKISEAFDLPYFKLKGASIKHCLTQLINHKEFTDNEDGPTLIHGEVFRPYEHCGYQIEEAVGYRDISKEWPKRDPLYNAAEEFFNTDDCEEYDLKEILNVALDTKDKCHKAFDIIKRENGVTSN